jgi:zinc transport system substrate-binding protein
MRSVILAAAAFAVSLSALASTPARAEVQVVASIVPVHSLVAGVMEGVAAPHLLVPGGASPHSFALRPSDARRLDHATAVFWIGPQLESFLERPLKALARNAVVVALVDAEGMKRLPYREGGPWEPDADEDEHHGEHQGGEQAKAGAPDHDHDRGQYGIDGHVWLDPENAIAMTRAIAQALGRADPTHKARYESNAARMVARLQALDTALQDRLAPAKGKPYIVFHDGYHYLEARYGLTPVGSITVSPELSPGAKRLLEIRTRIRKDRVACVFAEPQFEPKLVGTVIEGTSARAATLDPLGAALDPGPGAYFQLLENLAKDLNACLAGAS